MKSFKVLIGTGLLMVGASVAAGQYWPKETNTLIGVSLGKRAPKLPACGENDDEAAKKRCIDEDGFIFNGPDLGFVYVMSYSEDDGVVTSVRIATDPSDYEQMKKLAILRFGTPTRDRSYDAAWLGKNNYLKIVLQSDRAVLSLHDMRYLNRVIKERDQAEQSKASKL